MCEGWSFIILTQFSGSRADSSSRKRANTSLGPPLGCQPCGRSGRNQQCCHSHAPPQAARLRMDLEVGHAVFLDPAAHFKSKPHRAHSLLFMRICLQIQPLTHSQGMALTTFTEVAVASPSACPMGPSPPSTPNNKERKKKGRSNITSSYTAAHLPPKCIVVAQAAFPFLTAPMRKQSATM